MYSIRSSENDLPVGEAVVGRLGGHVGKVDSLPEHVAGGGRFGRRNLQTLNHMIKVDSLPEHEAGGGRFRQCNLQTLSHTITWR